MFVTYCYFYLLSLLLCIFEKNYKKTVLTLTINTVVCTCLDKENTEPFNRPGIKVSWIIFYFSKALTIKELSFLTNSCLLETSYPSNSKASSYKTEA